MITEDYKDEQEVWDEAARIFAVPDYMQSRAILDFRRMNQQRQDWYAVMRGTAHPMTHEYLATGPFTGLEPATLFTGYLRGFTAAALKIPQLRSRLPGGEYLHSNLNPTGYEQWYKPHLSFLGPITQEIVRDHLRVSEGGYSSGTVRLRGNEIDIQRRWMNRRPEELVGEDGVPRGDRLFFFMWRMTPIALELQGLWDDAYAQNPSAWSSSGANQFYQGTLAFLGSRAGLGYRPVSAMQGGPLPFNIQQIVRRKQQEGEELQEELFPQPGNVVAPENTIGATQERIRRQREHAAARVAEAEERIRQRGEEEP